MLKARLFRGVGATLVLSAAAAAASGGVASAQSGPDSEGSRETVVVTASRAEQNIADIPATIEVINEDDLLNTTGVDITDVLKKNSSVDVIQYPGGLAGVGLRGFRPEFSGTNKRVLVLIDGRPAGAESMGNIATAGLAR